MGRFKCSAFNCENSNQSDVKFFKFPLYNRRKLKKWLLNMKWKDWTPSRYSVLCSNHFEERYIDRTGRFIKLRDDAVPTIFSFPKRIEKKKVVINPKSKRYKPSTSEASKTNPSHSPPITTPTTITPSLQNQDPSQKKEECFGGSDKVGRWAILMDEALAKIDSFPYFFHGDYCVPQDIQWAPDDIINIKCEEPEKLIEVTEPWQWLGLDIRGPLPQTLNGHKYILTVTDYYSKWVEALPMQLCLSSQVATHIMDIISHFGYPLRILSRLPRDIVRKINIELRAQLKINTFLIIHHQQTGTLDLITQRLIDRMVRDVIVEHAADWDVFLPAKVFSLCFKEHSKTKERPFSMLCCKGLQPVKTPREITYTYSRIRESAFVVR